MTTTKPDVTRLLGIADEDDLIGSIYADDLTDALAFTRDTIRQMGTEDIADYLRQRHPTRHITDVDVVALCVRLNVTLEQLGEPQ